MKKFNHFVESLEFRQLLTAITTPVAHINGPTSVPQGSSITLMADTSQNPGTVSYVWFIDWNNPYHLDVNTRQTVIGTSTVISGASERKNAYFVTLNVLENGQIKSTDTTNITIVDVAPTATFSNDGPVVLGNSSTVRFKNWFDSGVSYDADFPFYSYDFNNDGDFTDPGDIFGTTFQPDGNGSLGGSANYTFATPGQHIVHGRVADWGGAFNDYYTTVTVIGKPTAVPGGPYSVNEGASIMLDGSSSAGDVPLTTYEWDFNYNGSTFDVDATGSTPTFSALALDGPLSRTIGLRVTDSASQVSSVVTSSVNVNNVAPTASFNINYATQSNTTVTYEVRLSAPIDPSAADTTAKFKYSFDINNDGDFNDAGEVEDGTFPSVLYVATAAESHVFHARIKDKDGAYTDYTKSANLEGPHPVQAIITGPLTVPEGTPSVTLSALSSTGPWNKIRWTLWGYQSSGATLTIPTAIYGGPNAIPFKLEVYNGGTSQYDSISTQITIVNVAPTATLTNNGPIMPGTTATVSFADATDASPYDHINYSFDFNNDGDFTDPGDVVNSSTASANFTFASSGSFIVRGRVADDDGGFTDYTTTVKVLSTTPVAVPGGPYTVNEGSSISLNGSGSSVESGTITDYEWDFDYDGINFQADATGATPTFSAAGLDGNSTRTIALRVKSSSSEFTIATTTVSIANVAPGAFISSNGTVTLGTATTIQIFNATDPSMADSTAGFMYSFDLNNDGDFTDAGDVSNSASPSASITYSTLGTHIIRGRITDKDGGFNDYTAGAYINPAVTNGAKIAGNVFSDKNKTGVKDSSELGLSGITVWLDLDGDKVIDSNETATTTDASGNFQFTNVPQTGSGANTRVRAVIPAGDTQILPANGYGYQVTLTPGYNNTGKNFAIFVPTITPPPPPTTKGSIAGFSFSDSNKNGKYDTGESLQAGKTVFIDLDGDNVLDTNEVKVITDSNGAFKFSNLLAGNYKIRRVIPAGYKLTTPFSNVTLLAGQNLSGIAIGSSAV